ncbi:hypothetical protein PIB30_009414 [Stylosanthes scabra]|uniref:Uncharacterized protein n=1 Tax=Stylosanthes scabra TaxID=79078 RepID=A0ABU6W385_9FABA|nr:hypothetical protein [Stylosanthes scabra]
MSLGDGAKIRPGKDVWVGNEPLPKRFPRLFCVSNKKDSVIGYNDAVAWRFSSNSTRSFVEAAVLKRFGEPNIKHIYEEICKGLVPPRVELVVWFAIMEGLNTIDRLLRRTVIT